MTILCMMMLAGCASDTERTSADRIVYGALTEPHSLHPLIGTDSASTEAQSLIYDALVCVNGDKEMTGDLAESWTVSSGGKVYTFRLKDGIMWHDGQPFTADDVVFTFDMARDKRNGYIDARELANIERVTASGNEVTFRLAKADSAFLARVAGISILPKHIWQKVQNLREEAPRIAPVGTGPYRLVEWKRRSTFVSPPMTATIRAHLISRRSFIRSSPTPTSWRCSSDAEKSMSVMSTPRQNSFSIKTSRCV